MLPNKTLKAGFMIILSSFILSFNKLIPQSGVNISYVEPIMPKKEQMIEDLYKLLEKITENKISEAKVYLNFPLDISEETIKVELKKMVVNNEISKVGIRVLSEKGLYGKFREVFLEKSDNLLKRAQLNSDDECYGIRYNEAEVAGKWNGKNFIFFRLDDVGKLKGE